VDADADVDVAVNPRAHTATGVDVDVDADADVDVDTGVDADANADVDVDANATGRERTATQRSDANRQNMNDTQQGDVTYDRMGNTAAGMEEDSYMTSYDALLNNAELDLSAEERAMLEEAKADYVQRRESMQGQLDQEMGAYYSPVVEARPRVKYGELAEEIREEMDLPAELRDANIEGTVLVRFIVDEEGDIESAEVIDGILGERGDDGSLTNTFRLNEAAKEGIVDEIENENLIKLNREDRNRIVEALRAESARVVSGTSGQWQPATQDDQPVKMVMLMPLRVSLNK
jgi:hypothetical protein